MAGVGGLSEKAYMFIDFHLQPFVLDLPSCLRDSMLVIHQFGDLQVEGQPLLVTLDVESLYTNILHQHGMAAVMYFLNAKDGRDRMMESFIIDHLNFVLMHK